MSEIPPLVSLDAAQQPRQTDLKIEAGIFVKTIEIDNPGVVVPQHEHTYDHLSLLGRGGVRVWQDGELLGDFFAPAAILIKARTKHTFMTLVTDTVIFCTHNVGEAEEVDIHAEHQLHLGDV